MLRDFVSHVENELRDIKRYFSVDPAGIELRFRTIGIDKAFPQPGYDIIRVRRCTRTQHAQ